MRLTNEDRGIFDSLRLASTTRYCFAHIGAPVHKTRGLYGGAAATYCGESIRGDRIWLYDHMPTYAVRGREHRLCEVCQVIDRPLDELAEGRAERVKRIASGLRGERKEVAA